nr:hypothetical protein [Candidatus Sigynarchaeota archaeon]
MVAKRQQLFFTSVFLIFLVASWHPNIPGTASRVISSQVPSITVTTCGMNLSILVNGTWLFRNSTFTFEYVLSGESTARDFASTAMLTKHENVSVQDARGNGTKHVIAYQNAHVLITLHVIVYPFSNAIMVNATIMPLQDYAFNGELSLFSLPSGDLLPGIPRREM